MRFTPGIRRDTLRVALVGPRQLLDRRWNGGGEQQRASLARALAEDELQVLAKAEIQHLVGLVQDDGAQGFQGEGATRDVVAQPARRTDDDMRPRLQPAPLGARVHAADAGGERRARRCVKPFELSAHLQSELARGRDDEREWIAGRGKGRLTAEQGVREGEAERDGLARAGLCRDEQVLPVAAGLQHGALDGRQRLVATCAQGVRQRGGDALELGHIVSR